MMRSALLFLAMAAQQDGADLVPVMDGDLVELTAESSDAKLVHDSANDFAGMVGQKLKQEFPKKVLDPRMDLRVFMRSGKRVYQIRWSARLVPSTPKQADCHFDRRGSLVNGQTLKEAIENAEVAEFEEELLEAIVFVDSCLVKKSDGKTVVKGKACVGMAKFHKKYGNVNSPPHFGRDSFAGSKMEGGFWYVRERFFTAKSEQCK